MSNMFNGTVIELAQSIPDHEVRGKLNGDSFDFELIEYGTREPRYTLSKSGSEVAKRWHDGYNLPNTWERTEIPQKWDWVD